jgi:hypothetical protein
MNTERGRPNECTSGTALSGSGFMFNEDRTAAVPSRSAFACRTMLKSFDALPTFVACCG